MTRTVLQVISICVAVAVVVGFVVLLSLPHDIVEPWRVELAEKLPF